MTTQGVDWLRATPAGRVLAWTLLLLPILAAWSIKWGGLRESSLIEDSRIASVLGWAPSFLVSFAFAYAWPALRLRPPGSSTASGRRAFLPECLSAALILGAGELSDLLFPQIGSTSRQTYDPADLVALVSGACTAFLLYHLVLRGTKSADARPPS